MDETFTQFLLGALALAFAGWGALVAWGVRAVIQRVDTISSAVIRLDKDLNTWVHQTEHRLTSLEEWKNNFEDDS